MRSPSRSSSLLLLLLLLLPILTPTPTALFYLQYCRLLLYRFFTEPALDHGFRTFCLSQSLQVSKISAHLIFRAARSARFDRCFGMRTEELVHLQTLRSAVILLLGHCWAAHHEPSLLRVSRGEVDVCIRALRSIAAHHELGRKLLSVFEDFADTFGYECGQPVPQSQSSQQPQPHQPHPQPHPQPPRPQQTRRPPRRPNPDTVTPADGAVKREIARPGIDFLPPPLQQQPAHLAPLQWEFPPHSGGQNYSHTTNHVRRGGDGSSSNTRGHGHLGSGDDDDDNGRGHNGGGSGASAHLFGAQYAPVYAHGAWTTDPFDGDLHAHPPLHDMGHSQRERTMSIGDLRLDWEALQHTLQFDTASGAPGLHPPLLQPLAPLPPHPHPQNPPYPHHLPQPPHHGQPPPLTQQHPLPPHLQQPQHSFWGWSV